MFKVIEINLLSTVPLLVHGIQFAASSNQQRHVILCERLINKIITTLTLVAINNLERMITVLAYEKE